jgi:hypothetical protein
VIAVQRKRTMLWMSAVAASALIIGYLILQSDADSARAYPPNGKANHHPKTE